MSGEAAGDQVKIDYAQGPEVGYAHPAIEQALTDGDAFLDERRQEFDHLNFRKGVARQHHQSGAERDS